MAKSAKLAPPYSQVLLMDEAFGEQIPTLTGGKNIASTAYCVTIDCQAFMDGETHFTLGLKSEVNPGSEPAFEGLVETPNRKIAIATVERKVVLEVGVEESKTIVWIWVNRPSEPDDVVVGIS
jgi:hypothetical protein